MTALTLHEVEHSEEVMMAAPLAVRWAKKLHRQRYETGSRLNGDGIELARKVGVQRPDLIRVIFVEEMPTPSWPLLREVSDQIGLFSRKVSGMTIGYLIYVQQSSDQLRTLSRELRHVYQYERLGSIRNFLETYFNQLIVYGRLAAPLEVEARRYEISEWSAVSQIEKVNGRS